MKKKIYRKNYAPSNHPSKYIICRFGRDKVVWLQQHSTTWSHKPVRNGHTMISGIVRQKVKEEIRDEIRRALEEKKQQKVREYKKKCIFAEDCQKSIDI